MSILLSWIRTGFTCMMLAMGCHIGYDTVLLDSIICTHTDGPRSHSLDALFKSYHHATLPERQLMFCQVEVMSLCYKDSFCVQVLAALFLLIPFCYLSGSFTLSPVAEEASKARHLQLLSGCPPFIYWAGSYVSAQPCSLLHHARLRRCLLPLIIAEANCAALLLTLWLSRIQQGPSWQ